MFNNRGNIWGCVNNRSVLNLRATPLLSSGSSTRWGHLIVNRTDRHLEREETKNLTSRTYSVVQYQSSASAFGYWGQAFHRICSSFLPTKYVESLKKTLPVSCPNPSRSPEPFIHLPTALAADGSSSLPQIAACGWAGASAREMVCMSGQLSCFKWEQGCGTIGKSKPLQHPAEAKLHRRPLLLSAPSLTCLVPYSLPWGCLFNTSLAPVIPTSSPSLMLHFSNLQTRVVVGKDPGRTWMCNTAWSTVIFVKKESHGVKRWNHLHVQTLTSPD